MLFHYQNAQKTSDSQKTTFVVPRARARDPLGACFWQCAASDLILATQEAGLSVGLTTALPPAASPNNATSCGRCQLKFEFVLLLPLGCARTSGARRVARGALAWRVGCLARWPVVL